jgi:hypothetical protein
VESGCLGEFVQAGRGEVSITGRYCFLLLMLQPHQLSAAERERHTVINGFCLQAPRRFSLRKRPINDFRNQPAAMGLFAQPTQLVGATRNHRARSEDVSGRRVQRRRARPSGLILANVGEFLMAVRWPLGGRSRFRCRSQWLFRLHAPANVREPTPHVAIRRSMSGNFCLDKKVPDVSCRDALYSCWYRRMRIVVDLYYPNCGYAGL